MTFAAIERLSDGGAGSTAYTLSGNIGVRIELRNGEEVLVGSQRYYELASAIAARIVAPRQQDQDAWKMLSRGHFRTYKGVTLEVDTDPTGARISAQNPDGSIDYWIFDCQQPDLPEPEKLAAALRYAQERIDSSIWGEVLEPMPEPPIKTKRPLWKKLLGR
jgi:hypothetical protein